MQIAIGYEIFVFSGSALTFLQQCPLGRAPPGTALLAPPQRRSRSPQAVSAHSRDDPLASVAVPQQRARSRLAFQIVPPDRYGLTCLFWQGISWMNLGIVPTIGFAIAVGSNQHPHDMVDEDMTLRRQSHFGP